MTKQRFLQPGERIRLHQARRREDPSPFQVLVVAEREEAIATAAGMRVLPDCALAACPALDILVVPGGWGTRRQLQNELIDWVAERGRQVISSGNRKHKPRPRGHGGRLPMELHRNTRLASVYQPLEGLVVCVHQPRFQTSPF